MDIQSNFPIEASSQDCQPILSYDSVSLIAILSSVLGILWAGYNLLMLRRIDLQVQNATQTEEGLIQDMPQQQKKLLLQFGYKTYDASLQFVKLLYLLCFALVIISFLLLWFLTQLGPSAAIAFLVGSFITVAAGIATLISATRSSPRVAYCTKFGIGSVFRTAYQAASATSFAIASLNLLAITVVIEIYKEHFDLGNSSSDPEYYRKLFQAVAGYGLGASLVAFVTRMGGCIFQAATHVGSELIGKVEGSLPINHSRNAATVALHAGHGIEGMIGGGSDLIGSYSQLTCVAFLLGSTSLVGWSVNDDSSCGANLGAVVLPLLMLSFGLIASIIVSIVGVIIVWIQSLQQLQKSIRMQRIISSVLVAALLYLSTFLALPSSYKLQGVVKILNDVHSQWQAFLCSFVGVIAYIVLSFFTQFATSKDLPFARSLADKCRKGPAASVTLGLAFGYLSSLGPALIVLLAAYQGYEFLGFYGIALSILGFISTFPIQLALQSLGPIASDALTSAQIANLGEQQKQSASALASVGQTASMVNRGISIGCSALIGIVLFGGFLRNANLDSQSVQDSISLKDPLIFSGLMIGGVFPFILSGLTVKAARKAINPFVTEVQRQLREDEGIAREDSQADYAGSVRPSSITIIKHLIAPIIIPIVLSLTFGLAFSSKLVAGLLPGMLVSGLQFAASTSSSGEAWLSAKLQLLNGEIADEDGRVHGVGSAAHNAITIGNLMGIMIKKNASCSICSSIKLIGMIAVLFGSKFAQLHP